MMKILLQFPEVQYKVNFDMNPYEIDSFLESLGSRDLVHDNVRYTVMDSYYLVENDLSFMIIFTPKEVIGAG